MTARHLRPACPDAQPTALRRGTPFDLRVTPSPATALACTLAAALALIAAPARAQDAAAGASALRARSLAASCAQCHGTDGRAPPGAVLPGLAGVPAPQLAEQMKAFKRGSRPGSVMPQLARGYSDAQIDQLAAWFAQVPAVATTP